MLNTIRLNPFFAQGPATLAAKDRPLLPRNVDYSFGVMHAAITSRSTPLCCSAMGGGAGSQAQR